MVRVCWFLLVPDVPAGSWCSWWLLLVPDVPDGSCSCVRVWMRCGWGMDPALPYDAGWRGGTEGNTHKYESSGQKYPIRALRDPLWRPDVTCFNSRLLNGSPSSAGLLKKFPTYSLLWTLSSSKSSASACECAWDMMSCFPSPWKPQTHRRSVMCPYMGTSAKGHMTSLLSVRVCMNPVLNP